MINLRAAVLYKIGSPLLVQDLEFRGSLSNGQILVQMISTAVCGSQIGEIDGIKGPDPYLPHCLGHEGIAYVLDSNGSSKVSNGDIVILHWRKTDGVEAQTPVYSSRIGPVNAGRITTFMDKAIISENRMTRLSVFSAELAPLLTSIGCAHLTSYGILTRELSGVNLNRVLLIGGGGLAQTSILYLKFFKSGEIHVIEPNSLRREQCLNLGATLAFESISDVSELNYDVVLEFTGISANIEFGYKALTPTGTISLVGVSKLGSTISIDPMPLHYGRNIVGSFGGSAIPSIDIPKIVEILSSEQSIFQRQERTVIQLESINDAIQKLRLGKIAGRVIISFQ
jgi:Zn-dependent alcohol dehydrogenase